MFPSTLAAKAGGKDGPNYPVLLIKAVG